MCKSSSPAARHQHQLATMPVSANVRTALAVGGVKVASNMGGGGKRHFEEGQQVALIITMVQLN